MNFALIFYQIQNKIHEWSSIFKTRRAYCVISLLNYIADLILISWMFAKTPVFLDALFCISTMLISISITGLYLRRPSIMLPDVIYKVIVSACALFNAAIEAENKEPGAAAKLILVFVALLSHIYENYFLFNAIATFYREQEGLEARRPPPEYNLFWNERRDSGATEPTSKRETVENGERSNTPPPSYAIAMERMKELRTNV